MEDQGQSAEIEQEIAAWHLLTGVPSVRATMSAREVIRTLIGERFECADVIFVTNAENELEGIVRINDLFAHGDRLIGEIMEPEHEAVRLTADQEEIALLAMKYNMIAVPVINDENKLIGAVPPEALFGILRAEHMEDLQQIAGIVAHEKGPYVALGAPVLDRIRRRLPWLLFGLLASSLITILMSGFEETLASNVTVAFFVPALVYIAGAMGSQAVSVAVRGLAATNVSIVALLKGELVIGVAIGIALGTVAFVSVLFAFDDLRLSLAVGLTILAGGTLSAMVGFALPWMFQRAGSDPALGSGPVCTIIQDVVALSIYFVLVVTIVI